MLSRNQIKYAHSLKLKKFREKENVFIAEGGKIVCEIIKSPIKVLQVFATSDFIKEIKSSGDSPEYCGIENVEIVEVSEDELKKISNLTTPNEVFAIAEVPNYELTIETLSSQLTILLDDISDPGNLGTIIRIADWFGIENIICSEPSVDCFNPKVVQATMGSIVRVKVHYTPLEEILRHLQKKTSIYGALLEGENIYEKKLEGKGFILIGNESRGISEKLLPYITDKITIPPYLKNGHQSESLNAAIATAIICSEFRRS